MKKFLITFLILLPLLPAQALRLDPLSVTASRLVINQAVDQTVKFKTPTGIDNPIDTITIQWANGFDLSNITINDIDFSHGVITGLEIAEGLAAVPANGVWGVSIFGNVITLTPPLDAINGEVVANSWVVVQVGTNAIGGTQQISNPGVAGNYNINVAGGFGDSGVAAVAILNQDSITVSATVPTKTKPPGGGGGELIVFPDVKPPTVYKQIHPTFKTIYLLQGGKEKINDVYINNSKDGVVYPTEETWKSLRQINLGDNVFYLFAKDRQTKANSQIVSALVVRWQIGDTNGDTKVNDFDLAGVAGHWHYGDWWQGDFDENGIVNDFDLAGLASHWTG